MPWRWGEIQVSTKKATTKTAMATETAMVTDSDDIDVDANANDSASTTVMRTTRPGCAMRWDGGGDFSGGGGSEWQR
jgi:hypothetical protein